jgi:hypothetical protein
MRVEAGEARLEALDLEIECEEEAIAALHRRARSLEVEVAAWPPPPGIRGPHQIAADRSRVFEEAFLGLVGGWVLAAIVWVMGAFQAKGHL